MEQTNVDRALEALESEHEGDPERQSLVRLSRRFKSSWLELGAALADVRKNESWRRWGYDSLDSYAKTELKLRSDTVEKLTGSYAFLHKRAPEVLKRDPLEALPSYQAVDYLRRVEEKAETDRTIPQETLTDVRKQILEDHVPITKVARLYNDTLFPVSDKDKKAANQKAMRGAAQKLRELLGEANVLSKDLVSALDEALDQLLEQLSEAKKAA